MMQNNRKILKILHYFWVTTQMCIYYIDHVILYTTGRRFLLPLDLLKSCWVHNILPFFVFFRIFSVENIRSFYLFLHLDHRQALI